MAATGVVTVGNVSVGVVARVIGVVGKLATVDEEVDSVVSSPSSSSPPQAPSVNTARPLTARVVNDRRRAGALSELAVCWPDASVTRETLLQKQR